jgi:hypothetical protein
MWMPETCCSRLIHRDGGRPTSAGVRPRSCKRRKVAVAAASADILEPLHIEYAATVSEPVRRQHKSCGQLIATDCVEESSLFSLADLTSHAGHSHAQLLLWLRPCGPLPPYRRPPGTVILRARTHEDSSSVAEKNYSCQPKSTALGVLTDRSRNDDNWRFSGSG